MHLGKVYATGKKSSCWGSDHAYTSEQSEGVACLGVL